MTLSAIFAKPINRPIEGVIKADDEASLKQEVEEYVLTREVAKRLNAFVRAYNDYQGANGVWISGFFGSGKSHLLKMLALLLENRVVDGATTLDMFLPKVEEDEFLRGDIQRAVAIPSRSILFNIDQKADVISKSEIDALLEVFVKVFDEMCGYYGKQGYIARFERDLDGRGQYDAFKQAFREISGRDWERGREQAVLERANIAAAYAQASGQPHANAEGILDKYRADYRVSIEDFAEQVQGYIERQGPGFRLNFFVDEVGQYIANNVKLMTNLQTIAESLATKSRGRAWLVVTAQEEMDTVVGEMSQQRGNDFTKIQARFVNRMKLTSTDVAEVIRKRLLAKNEQGRALLSMLYEAQHNNFRTLFDFADGGRTYRNYRDQTEFIDSYPFIPYQFELFQSAIQGISQHGAFEGRHTSVGERSMLEVFQQVVLQIGDRQIGQLATFDLMFEGIRNTLKAQFQTAILTAERQLDDDLALRVLKALFLVKYVKEFKATVRNITVLMLDDFDVDMPAFRKRVEAALNLLEQQTYIQRNGDLFEYLTDEERDVEAEIKNTEVETSAVTDELGAIVFDYVLKDRKVRYDDHGQDYPFARRLDERLLGRDYELSIHVISPFHEHAGNDMVLRAQSMGRDELLVLLPASERLVSDLLMYKRTDKYVRQNVTTAQKPEIRRILGEKGLQNNTRQTELRTLVADLLSRATLIVNGQNIEAGATDPRTRIIQGFHELLARTYPNLRMLRGVTYTDNDIHRYLQAANTLLGDDAATFSEAEQEMLAFIQGNQRTGLRTTLLSLNQRFERKPYGWYLAAMQCTLAKLLARGKVEARRDGTMLEGQELERALRNTQSFANVIIDPQIDFTASQVRRLKDFYAEFCDGPPQANEAKALALETAAALRNLNEELARLRMQTESYPFLTAVNAPMRLLHEVMDKPYAFYLTDFSGHAEALLAAKEEVIDPIRRFMAGTQSQIYAEAGRFLRRQEPNLSYVEGEEAAALQAILADPDCFRGNRMAEAKMLLDALREKAEAAVQQVRAAAIATAEERRQRLTGMAEFAGLSGEQQQQLRQPIDALIQSLERQTLIAVIRDTLRQFDERDYQRLLGQMTAWAQPAPGPQPGADGGRVAEPAVQYVTQQSLRLRFEKDWLQDEADVDAYVGELKAALLRAIAKGMRIRV